MSDETPPHDSDKLCFSLGGFVCAFNLEGVESKQ